MNNNSFMRVSEVAEAMGISQSYAYKIVRQLNAELTQKGLITVSGRVSRKYFNERVCYNSAAEERTDI